MIQKHSYNKLTWIDIQSPTTEEITSLIKEYGIHPLVGDELLNPTDKPKINFYKKYFYTVLHFPTRVKQGDRHIVVEKEVDFVVGRDFIITTKYDEVEPLHNFSKVFEVNSIIDKSDLGDHAGFIFYYMIKRLYKNMENELDTLKAALHGAENNVFEGDEKRMVKVLSDMNREIIDFKQTSFAHKNILEALSLMDTSFFGESFTEYLRDIELEYGKIHQVIVNTKELLSDLRETNDSLLSTKQNETMRVLTIMAFVTFPLSLITDIFSMNTTHSPIIGHPYDFEIIVGTMLCAAFLMFGFFKYKKWL